jgi:ABC-type lipoprotein export system ATPase subunit
MSTHNPLLALSSDRRLVIRNGGIAAIIKTSDEERQGYGLSLICSR